MSFKGRQQANREIVALLADLVERHPDMRFTQLLFNVDLMDRTMNVKGEIVIQDNIHEESTETLARIYPQAERLRS